MVRFYTKEFIVHSLAEKRLQARVGDYYECVSETQLVFDTENNVVCAGDISHDMSLSIAIGLSLCSLVICVLFGLAINHLRQKDEVFKPVDTTGDDQKS
ncbi:unnamed protein product [Schistosoma mattheei]|uniref:Uncharacterized protein n=1 Tax=Schistosoma mattheei TaxID=31246 RepID=A0A183PC30_9TREM|nr:unnamed protein product [Schistosoma mattheei]